MHAAARFALAGVFMLACAEPFTPRAGTATLDDTGTGNFAAVAAGREHTCALTADGSAYCWGSNEFGQLGVADDGTTCSREDRRIVCQRRPMAVTGGLKFQKIRAGGAHTCALGVDYHIYCWGDNLRGELGDPGVRQSVTPLPVFGSALFQDLAAGGSHSCGLRTDGVLLCWGANDAGQLGIGTAGNGSSIPAATVTSQRFSSVAAGRRRTCARAPDGTSYCWGAVWASGIGMSLLQVEPVRVRQSPPFESLAVGNNTTCGISLDNHAFCWDANPAGGIGDGTTVGSSTPRAVSTTRLFVAISSGDTQTCGIADTGHAYCWGGDEFGQLGVSPATLNNRCENEKPCSTTPLRVSGWRVFSQITAGQGNHACALTLTGNIYCWGAGGMGQRGDGRTTAEWSPVKTLSPI